jgi:hypothetical protein
MTIIVMIMRNDLDSRCISGKARADDAPPAPFILSPSIFRICGLGLQPGRLPFVCRALLPGIFVTPVFLKRVGHLAVPFFVTLQVIQYCRQKMFGAVGRWMSQRFQ